MNNTLADFCGRLWFSEDIVVIERNVIGVNTSLNELKKKALYVGQNFLMSSITHKGLIGRNVFSYGTVEGTLVIEVE